MGMALYRKYRSRSLDEVVGQEQVTTLLHNALKQGRIAHAYLFTGPKGVGKTSIARILAHQINGLAYADERQELDIIEIDAASNNGVEDIRDLREKAQIAPVSAKKKVYIIDEVHMLSKPAFNALLKTLEEPPEHVVFILATTDLDKVPETIISRTQRHTFKRASSADIVKNLKRIATAEKVTVEPAALDLIARHSDGSFRDSVSLFDQLLSIADDKNGLTRELVVTNLGLVDDDEIDGLIEATLAHDVPKIVQILDVLESTGTAAKIITSQLAAALQERMVHEPELMRLLDELLDVTQSSHPSIKLLTTLSLYRRDNEPPSTITPPHDVPPAPTDTLPTQKTAPNTQPIATPKPAPAQKKKATPAQSATQSPFDWPALITYVKTHHVALHSVLAKCEPLVDGNTLRLYTKNSFYKKKLDDSRYRALLNASLEALGQSALEIETKASHPPLKDGTAAKVAAIMGGGEEVSIDDDTE